MDTIKKIGFTVCLMISFVSCDKKEKEEGKSINSNELEVSERKIEEKRINGDTLAFSHEILETILPGSIEGFNAAGKGNGTTTNEEFISWSVIEKKYKKENQNLSITLADYNGAYGLYAGATALFDNAEMVDNGEERVQLIMLKDGKLKGRESFKKESREAYLLVGIEDRFLVAIWADNQSDTELIKKVFESMDTDKLMDR